MSAAVTLETNQSNEGTRVVRDNLDYTLFSWSVQGALNPLAIQRAQGVCLYDFDGKRYLDFSSQLMNMNVGHNHPTVNAAIRDQLESLAYVFPGMATKPRGDLGKKLTDIAPKNLKKTFFTNGGADAVENAIKLARVHTGRHKIITRYRSYHGSTHGAMAAGGDPRKFAVDRDLMPSVVHVEDPYVYRCPWGTTNASDCAAKALEHLERVIKFENPDNVAAILMEGESGSSGCIKYPKEYWPGLREIADRYGIMLICDEVMSGFGRCGQWFAVQNFDVEPDMIVMAKGLTCGYVPLGGVMVTDEIAKTFDRQPLPLGLTYSSHALACASALGCISVYENENLIARAREMGQKIEARAAEMADKHPSIGDFRNTGMLGCFELVKNRQTKEPMAPWNAKPDEMKVMNQVAAKLRERGLFTFVRWNFVFVAPPLVISDAELQEGLDIISDAIAIADAHTH